MTVNGQTTTFVYDGDGRRVKKVQNGQTTVYIGDYYEKNLSTGVVTKYYYANGQRVAQRQGSAVYYFTGDHLGSTSLVTDASGGEVARQKYYPFGAPRSTSGTLPTDYRFTGQRSEEAALGSLYDYNARFYSPVLGRFIQPDTVVPEPDNPQALNRYAYVLNNALRYTDPTGYYEEEEIEAYLQYTYKEHWRRYWDAWRADKVFWAMLRAAHNGYRLYAPTTTLGVGFFGPPSPGSGSGFTFMGENGEELWLYQGRGPYALEKTDRQFEKGFSVQAVTSEHPFVGTDENIGLTWEQPIYNYSAHGPEPTGYVRRISYTYAGVSIDWGVSSSIPSLIGVGYAALRSTTKGAVQSFLSGPVGTALFAADIVVALNEGININYQLQVDYKDTRTYLVPPSRCQSPCFKAAP